MTCLEVRELLPEHAIGVLGELEHERIQRHLQTCAGCRKEAGDLGQAASTLAFALARPARPAPGAEPGRRRWPWSPPRSCSGAWAGAP